MKYIFDFDDTLSDTKELKEYIFSSLEDVGVSSEVLREEYKKIRSTNLPFSLKEFLNLLAKKYQINASRTQLLYEDILKLSSGLLNKDLVEIVKKAGMDNCYIVTNGDEEFQKDKIKSSGISPLFKEIYVTPGSKKDIIEKICIDNKDEEIIFIDNKDEFFNDLDMKKCFNLKTILYTGQNLDY